MSWRHFVRCAGALALGSVGATLLAACGCSFGAPTDVGRRGASVHRLLGSRQLPRRPIRQPATSVATSTGPAQTAAPARLVRRRLVRCPRRRRAAASASCCGATSCRPTTTGSGQFGNDWGSKNGVTVKVDHVSTNDLPGAHCGRSIRRRRPRHHRVQRSDSDAYLRRQVRRRRRRSRSGRQEVRRLDRHGQERRARSTAHGGRCSTISSPSRTSTARTTSTRSARRTPTTT